ncbi:unnamed protein product, partial [Staurois parvus]
WGLWAIGAHGAPVSLPKLKKAYEKGTRGISWGPLLTRALGQCPSFQMVSPPLILSSQLRSICCHHSSVDSFFVNVISCCILSL